MRIEVKVALVVAAVILAGAGVWYWSRSGEGSTVSKLPFDAKPMDAKPPLNVNLAQDAKTRTEKPATPADRPLSRPGSAAPSTSAQPTGDLRRETPQDPRRGDGSTRPPPSSPTTRVAVPAPANASAAGSPDGRAAQPVTQPASRPADLSRPITSPPGSPSGVQPSASPSTERPTVDRPAAETPTSQPGVSPPLRRPASGPSDRAATPTTPNVAATPPTYTVADGDTLIAIARAVYGSEKMWTAIKAANPGLDETRLRVGQVLNMPPKSAAAGGVTTPPRSDAPPGATTAGVPTSRPATGATYVVAEGDTLTSIARAVLGDENRWLEIFSLNRDKLQSADHIEVGMELKLPAAKSRG
jgi:nucleoid-associated protein YgaU